MLAPRTVFLLAALLIVAPLLAACAAVTTADGRRMPFGSSEFRAYVEGVFREQNKTASDLAFAIDAAREDAAGSGPARARELGSAEDALLAACDGLNELAASRRDDRRVSVRRSAAIARKAPQCERATLAARALLTTSSN
jgi:hypothetical protein